MEWIEALNRALDYVEHHLTDELDSAAIASAARFSPFYLQRVFSVLSGMSLMEYVRARRLSVAAQELRATDIKVIDAALKYGYETPESFEKAFRRFHGASPSAVRRSGAMLRCLSPLTIQIDLKGGSIMDYQIEEMQELTLFGKEWRVPYDKGFELVPGLWEEYGKAGLFEVCPGYLGVCFDDEKDMGKEFSYLIGCFADPEKDKPSQGFVVRTVPALTWAKFKVVGALPAAIQKVNRQVYTEWLPNNPDYELGYGMNIEMYAEGDMNSPDYEMEFWIPVKRKA